MLAALTMLFVTAAMTGSSTGSAGARRCTSTSPASFTGAYVIVVVAAAMIWRSSFARKPIFSRAPSRHR